MHLRARTCSLGLALVALALLAPLSSQLPGGPPGELHAAPKMNKRQANQLKGKLVKAAKSKDWDAVPGLIKELAAADDKKTFKLMLKVAGMAPVRYRHEVSLALRTVAGQMKSKAVQKELRKAARKARSAAVRRALIIHLAAEKDWDTLIAAIRDKDEGVAALAAWNLVDARVTKAVEPMIDELARLEKKRAGIWDVLKIGLGRMLGKKLSNSVSYRSRWTVVKGQGGLSSVKQSKPKKLSKGAMSSGVRLFGRSIECTRVVFILDVSGSMKAVDPNQKLYDDEDDKLRSTRRKKPKDVGGTGSRKPKGKTRLQRAQRALKKVINKLPSNYKINIIAYSTRVKIWRANDRDTPPKLWALTPAIRKDACKFVDSFAASGVTATDTSLVRAFDVEGARCFYLLSDGAPTHDGTTPVPTEDILSVLREKKSRHVIVHTLGFKGADRAMMKAVAKETVGRYSDIR